MAKLKGGTRIYGEIKIDGGIRDSNNQIGIGGSVLISTGVGIAWTSSAGSGAQGIQGVQGTQGVQGLQGTQGIQGVQGTQGVQGLQGLQGTQGVQGLQGLQGTQGLQGLQGTQGTQGLQGVQGLQGTQGLQGLQGTQGTQGLQGLQGLQGTQGTQGLQGLQGAANGGGGGGGSITANAPGGTAYYPLFTNQTAAGSLTDINISTSKLTYNDSTGTLSATIFTSLSDETQKTNITPIANALDLVMQMNGVRYDWANGHNKGSVGVIAQEIEKILPEVVTTNDRGLKTVSYGNIVGVLIEAIKEQQVRIEELERKINA